MMHYMTPFERTGYDLFHSMRDWENEFFGSDKTAAQLRSCKTDIRDTGDDYIMEAELPGFTKEEIKLDVQDDVLTLTAVHKEKTEEEKAKDGTYLRKERSRCSYQQKLDLSGIDVEHLEASYENGILTLKMPKKKPQIPASKRIAIQ
ncbi:Hsp20 family protein [Ruminococcus sp.]|jgi:HSP20 family protein|uniref:Hsp20 family protein n=1 Tax=Ruminococcus sp. TaxID=41978 RepID=UPI0025EC1B28|nr:Hsp20 family protein [Ruminococcus sp.]MEE0022363.1 Hsp20 family protein [Ruminococcus sp.]